MGDLQDLSDEIAVSPPLIYIGWALLAVWVGRIWPLRLLPEDEFIRVLSSVILTLGSGIAAAGFLTFAMHRTSFAPNAPANQLLTGGLFRWSRNPIYLGFAVVFVGAFLKSNNGWLMVCLPSLIVTMNRVVIVKEERKLLAAFGSEYEQYCEEVRRWI